MDSDGGGNHCALRKHQAYCAAHSVQIGPIFHDFPLRFINILSLLRVVGVR